MDKRQGALAALLGLVIVAGLAFWWMTQEQENPAEPVVAAPAPTAPMTSTVAAPLPGAGVSVAPAPAAESDAVALSDEVIDKIKKEGEELSSRATDLDAQVKDGEALIALKEKQIKDLEAQLKKAETLAPAKP
jgi:septal ring factor EnvC (AmiA/AmiB activator)